MNKFGENIKFLRKNSGLTQMQFGAKYNTDDSNVSRWEKGKAIPKPETLKKIALDHQVSLDWLMGEQANNDPKKLDLKEIKKALLEKELVFGERELPKKQADAIRAILLAAIEREEAEEEK
jgi:transcriptional regulator with XRE-family HTH domain